jgi:hypothetical protein
VAVDVDPLAAGEPAVAGPLVAGAAEPVAVGLLGPMLPPATGALALAELPALFDFELLEHAANSRPDARTTVRAWKALVRLIGGAPS